MIDKLNIDTNKTLGANFIEIDIGESRLLVPFSHKEHWDSHSHIYSSSLFLIIVQCKLYFRNYWLITKINTLLFLFFSISLFASAQSAAEIKVADSLKKAVEIETQDTSKAKTLLLLSKTYSNSNPNIAIQYLNQATELLVNTPNDRILSDITNQLGNNYFYLGDFNNSLKYFLETLKICERRNNILGVATAHNNIGSIYFELNDPTNALTHHLEALNLRREYSKNDKDSKNEIAMSYGNVGNAYFAKSDYTNALEYYALSLDLSREIGNKQREALMLNNIGSVLAEQGKYDEAYSNFTKAYKIYVESESSQKIALCLNNIAELHYRKGEYLQSVEQYKNSIVYAEKASALSDLKTSYEGLKNCYVQLNDYEQAFISLQKYFIYRDSIFSEENTAQLNELLAKFDSDKKEQEITLLQKQKQVSSWLRNSLIAGSVLLVFLALALYSRNKVKQKANVELLAINKNIEAQKQIVDEQKLILEVHQKEIVDSFNYAKRIQYALLANENLLTKNIPNHFVYFNPKEIVSGDFYWATEDENYFYLAVCDCTGHGVPGAFMSLLNIGFLSEAIIEKKITEPNSIFNFVRQRLVESIGMEDQKDGMDGVLLRFSKSDNTIVYAAAHNAPVLVRANALVELPKDKIPVGKGEQNDEFSLFTLNYQKDDVLYIYTDGYADQFGGSNLQSQQAGGKKFKYKQLNELLLLAYTLPMQEQRNTLSTVFNKWKGSLEQVDDVCVVGIKL